MFEKCFPKLMLQLAEALVCLHSAKFSHNDLHDGNVLLHLKEVAGGLDARIGICDWGRATNEAEQKPLTLARNNRLRDYIAPEHLVENPPAQSRRKGGACACTTDVYAFGYLLKLVCKAREDRVPLQWLHVANACQQKEKVMRPSMGEVLDVMRGSLK